MSAERNNGGPAFPLPLGTMNCSEPEQSVGMTLRDYFAAKTMQGFCSGGTGGDPLPLLAALAYEMADAMLKAREA